MQRHLKIPTWLSVGVRALAVITLLFVIFAFFFKVVGVIYDLTWSAVPQAAVDNVGSVPGYLFLMFAKYFMTGTAVVAFTVFYCDLAVPIVLIFFGWVMSDSKVHLRNELREHVRPKTPPQVDWEMVRRINERFKREIEHSDEKSGA